MKHFMGTANLLNIIKSTLDIIPSVLREERT